MLVCSLTYHCLQMVGQRLLEMLALKFTSKALADWKLVHDRSRALSAFSRFVRQYLDKSAKVTSELNMSKELLFSLTMPSEQIIKKLKATFKCIKKGSLKLTIHKGYFGDMQFDFRGRIITPEPQRSRV